MGLDNGITLYNVTKEIENEIPNFDNNDISSVRQYNESKKSISLCYWRKCWNVREVFLRYLKTPYKEDGYYLIESEDIPAIIRGLSQLLSKEEWDERETIWTFEEQFENMIDAIVRLYWLKSYLIKHPEVEAIFYDSY